MAGSSVRAAVVGAVVALVGAGAVLGPVAGPAAGALPSVSSQDTGAAQGSTAQDGAGQPVSWAVSPVRVEGQPSRPNFVLRADPGRTIEDALVVDNHSDVDLVLGVQANDAFNTPAGGIDLLPGGEPARDVGRWVKVSTQAITVPARGSVTVPFRVEVPADAEPGDHEGGIVTTLTVSEPDARGNRVRVERRLGVRMSVRVAGRMRPQLEFTALSARYEANPNPFAPGEMVLTYRVENTGNVRLRARRVARVDPTIGPAVESRAEDVAELLPGNSYELTQRVDGVWPGFGTTSTVELEPYEPSGAELDPEPREAVARTTTTSVPWSQLLLAAVVVLVVVVVVQRRRPRGRRASDAPSAVPPSGEPVSQPSESPTPTRTQSPVHTP